MIKKENLQLSRFLFVMCCLIVAIHCQIVYMVNVQSSVVNRFINGAIRYSLTDMAVSGFYIVSGFLLFRKFKLENYAGILKKKVKTLFIPYILWNIIGMIYVFLITKVSFLQQYAQREEVVFSFSDVCRGIFLYAYNEEFWYIFFLIIFVIVSPIFYIFMKKKEGIILITFILIVYYIVVDEPIVQGYGVMSFWIGAVIGKIKPDFWNDHDIKITNKWIYYLMIGMLIIVRHLFFLNFDSNIINLIRYFVGVYLLWNIWQVCAADKEYTVRQSSIFHFRFFIYAMHWYVVSLVQKVLAKIPVNNWTLMLLYFGACTVTIMITWGIGLLWKRCLPRCYNVFTGAR